MSKKPTANPKPTSLPRPVSSGPNAPRLIYGEPFDTSIQHLRRIRTMRGVCRSSASVEAAPAFHGGAPPRCFPQGLKTADRKELAVDDLVYCSCAWHRSKELNGIRFIPGGVIE